MNCSPLLVSALLLIGAAARPSHAEVKTVHPPPGGEVPEAVVDAQGVWHLTYGRGGEGNAYGRAGNAYYVQSRDNGRTFTAPVRINRQADTVTVGMERGPKLALGKEGVIHVLWHGYYQKGGGVWYSRSTDGGQTFTAERNLVKPAYGTDNATIAADATGNVFALWTGAFPGVKPDPNSPTASPIVLVRSSDNGQTFSENQLLHSDHPASGRACGCCRLNAAVGADGKLYLAFRGGYQNIRDPYLLVGRKTDNDFHCVRVSEDDWHFG
jgi:hypothetical protein